MTWALTDHVCKRCFGRVLQKAGELHYRCSNCGETSEGNITRLCACGLQLETGKDAMIRCAHNPAPTPEFPSEIVAQQF